MIYDTIIVGSGAGGALLATRLAERGDRVLVIEQGDFPRRESPSEQPLQTEDEVVFQGRNVRPLLGRMVGGSTGLYGSVLLRPGESDFQPGLSYASYLEKELWDWPISSEDLAPYWTEVEDLLQVSGDSRQPRGHLLARSHAYQQKLPELTPFNQKLDVRLKAQGLQAFRLPLAISWDRCTRCGSCPGQICPTAARPLSWTAQTEQQRSQGSLTLWTRHRAHSLARGSSAVQGLWVDDARGQRRFVQGYRYVLAGGALRTAELMLRSELRDRSDQLGRNFMFHLGVACFSLGSKREFANHTFQKQLGFDDFYLGTPAFPHKLGLAQAIPVPGREMLQAKLGSFLPLSLLEKIRAHVHLFVLMIEDLPQAQNRVRIGSQGLKVEHGFHAYDHFRADGAKKLMTRLFAACGWPLSFGYSAGFEKQHLGHQVGTCRMGKDPQTSVVDTQGRVHGYENLFVADGSWLPSSLGVGPALTIMAQALRLADHLKPVSGKKGYPS